MKSTVIATIITVLGTGVLAGLGHVMKHLIDGISEKIDKLEPTSTAEWKEWS